MTSLRRGHSLFWHETHILLQFLLFAGFTTTKMSRCGSSIYVPNNMCGVCFEALMSNLTWLFCGHSWTEIFINQCVTFTEFVKAVQSENQRLFWRFNCWFYGQFEFDCHHIFVLHCWNSHPTLISSEKSKNNFLFFLFFLFRWKWNFEKNKKQKKQKKQKNTWSPPLDSLPSDLPTCMLC